MKTKLDKLTSTAKRLIELPYNQFNLDNYLGILRKPLNDNFDLLDTLSSNPIKLMSGLHPMCGILATDDYRLKNDKKNIVIVGKGILFDSGGYNLKTGKHIANMHMDKAGMIIAVLVADYFNTDKVTAWCPVTTNFIHNSKLTPNDIIKIGNKRVEVGNTDAEGRLILAEALNRYNQGEDDIIITIATLTGCCEYAVDKATGVFGGKKIVDAYLKAAKEVKEYAWELPIFDYMEKMYKKQPIKNDNSKIKAGTSEGACFIKQFIDFPDRWLHLDIAASAEKDGKATGIPIRSLIKFIQGQLK